MRSIRKLFSHNGFLRYFANTSWLLGEKILRIVVGLFVGVWVARYLGPEQFGLFSYTQSYVGLFSIIATFGLDGIIVRELVKDDSRSDLLMGTAFTLKFIGAFVVLLILSVAVNFTSNVAYTNFLIFIIASATIFQSFNVIDLYFQSKVLSRYVAFANSITLFISSLLKIVFILNDAPLMAFVWVVLLDSTVISIGYIYFYRKTGKYILKWKFKLKLALSLLKESWPLLLSGMVISVYMKIDQVMIKEMLGVEAVGQYAAAVRLSEAWYFIPMVIASSLFPAILNAKKNNEKLYYARLQKLYDLMVWLAIAIALPMTFFSDWVVHLLYGEDYQLASSVLVIHIWTGIFVFLGVASANWFMAENLIMLSFWRTFYGMLVNIALNIFLIPIYGLEGAAIASLFSQMMAAFLFDIFNKKTRVVFLMKLKSFVPIYRKGILQ